jgi:DNA polymerase III alpha subunit
MATNRNSVNHWGNMPFLGFSKTIAEEALESSALAPSERLRALCERALTNEAASAKDRMNRELDMLHRLGLDDLILALWDIHRFAINNGHLAMITGQFAGSLVAHLLGLTPANPIRHRLIFEPSLDPKKMFAPTRILFVSDGSEKIVEYARVKYWWDDSAEGAKPFRAFSQEWQSPTGGKPDQAAIDVLDHPGLSAIKKTVELIRAHSDGKDLPGSLADDDLMTFAVFQRGETDGVSQFESSGSQQLLREFMPDCVEELAAVIAIHRPEPIEAGMLREFVDRKHGQLEWSHPNPDVEDILDETHGVLLYWEQIAEIVHRVAGLELREGGDILKALCKRSHDVVSQKREHFRAGAQQRHVEPQVADAIFAEIEARGPHTFCKAHAMSYAYLAYQMAFLKAHYPEEFEAAVNSLEGVASA